MFSYSDESGLQFHIHVKPGEVGRYVIMPGDPKRVSLIASFLDDAVQIADNREYVTYTGTLNGEKVSVTSTGIGGPSSAIAMEELANCGADTFLRMGTCGGIDLDVIGGDAVIATGAIRTEGTSREYAPIEFPAVADIDVVLACRETAEKLGFRHHVGIVQCKDSFYGQHMPDEMPVNYELNNKWEAWKKLGVVASEMESAAMFTVASYRHVRCGSIFLAAANQERQKLGMSNPKNFDTKAVCQLAVESIRTLIENDKKRGK